MQCKIESESISDNERRQRSWIENKSPQKHQKLTAENTSAEISYWGIRGTNQSRIGSSDWHLPISRNIHPSSYGRVVTTPLPQSIGVMFRDLREYTGNSVLDLVKQIQKSIMLGEGTNVIKDIIKIQTVFELLKDSYDISTMDYEIYNEIQSKVTDLLIAVERKEHTAIDLVNHLSKIITKMVSLRKELRKKGAKLVTFEYTDKKIGGLRLFKIKK